MTATTETRVAQVYECEVDGFRVASPIAWSECWCPKDHLSLPKGKRVKPMKLIWNRDMGGTPPSTSTKKGRK